MLFKFNEIKSCNCYIFLLNFNLQLLWRLFLITFYQTIFRLRRLPRVFKLLPPRGGQCDQIELFLKDLGSKSALKSSPNIRWLLSLFWKMSNCQIFNARRSKRRKRCFQSRVLVKNKIELKTDRHLRSVKDKNDAINCLLPIDIEESSAFQITSPFNNKLGCFLKQN